MAEEWSILKQKRDCYKGVGCRSIFDRVAVKNGAILQVPVPRSSGGMLAFGGFASFAPTYRDPLEPLVAKLPVLTLQPWESALAPVHSANTRIPSIR